MRLFILGLVCEKMVSQNFSNIIKIRFVLFGQDVGQKSTLCSFGYFLKRVSFCYLSWPRGGNTVGPAGFDIFGIRKTDTNNQTKKNQTKRRWFPNFRMWFPTHHPWPLYFRYLVDLTFTLAKAWGCRGKHLGCRRGCKHRWRRRTPPAACSCWGRG